MSHFKVINILTTREIHVAMEEKYVDHTPNMWHCKCIQKPAWYILLYAIGQ